MGKTGHTVLVNPAGVETLARFTAGTPLTLELQDNRLMATSQRGERLGEIESASGPTADQLPEGREPLRGRHHHPGHPEPDA